MAVDLNIRNIIQILLITGVVLGVTGLILSFTSDVVSDVQDDSLETVTFTLNNESITFTNNATILSHTSRVVTTGTVMTNGTNSTIGTTNYVVYANGSVILDTVSSGELGHNINVNLTYNWQDDLRDALHNITGYTLEGGDNLTGQFPSIGTIGGAIVIIGMVLLIAKLAGI